MTRKEVLKLLKSTKGIPVDDLYNEILCLSVEKEERTFDKDIYTIAGLIDYIRELRRDVEHWKKLNSENIELRNTICESYAVYKERIKIMLGNKEDI